MAISQTKIDELKHWPVRYVGRTLKVSLKNRGHPNKWTQFRMRMHALHFPHWGILDSVI
jgi:hypothetical protein